MSDMTGRMGGIDRREWLVWVIVILGVLIGWGIQSSVASQMATAQADATSVSYPATWRKIQEKDALFAAADLDSGIYGPRVSVRKIAKKDLLPSSGTDNPGLGDPATAWSLRRGQNTAGYRILDIRPVRLHGREATHVEIVYLADPPHGQTNIAPGLMHAVDTLVAAGDQFYVFTFAAETHRFNDLKRLHEQLLAGWRLP
jgi:hypothetical protein